MGRGNPNLKKGGPSLNPNGRPPGLKNKFPTALKDKVLHACACLEAEGKDLASCAVADPQWFWENFVKPMLPKEVLLATDPSRPVTFRVVDDTSYKATTDDRPE
jgi:hypothetical protein